MSMREHLASSCWESIRARADEVIEQVRNDFPGRFMVLPACRVDLRAR
jgi:hypothetical protein